MVGDPLTLCVCQLIDAPIVWCLFDEPTACSRDDWKVAVDDVYAPEDTNIGALTARVARCYDMGGTSVRVLREVGEHNRVVVVLDLC